MVVGGAIVEHVNGGQGRRRSVDLRFLRPALNSRQTAVTRDYPAEADQSLRFVEQMVNSSFTILDGGALLEGRSDSETGCDLPNRLIRIAGYMKIFVFRAWSPPHSLTYA